MLKKTMNCTTQHAKTDASDDHYLIYNPSPLVRKDIAEAVAAARPGAAARIHCAASEAALLRLLDGWGGQGRFAVSIISATDRALVDAVMQRGGAVMDRVVLMGDAVEEHEIGTRGYEVLHRPFSDAEVQALVMRPA